MLEFNLRKDSKFQSLSLPQAAADAAIAGTDQSGIVVFPCGGGKTALFLRAACRGCLKVLVLEYESQGVLQTADVILQETDVGKDFLCVYTAEKKTEPNFLACFMVATYSMFAGTNKVQSKLTKRVSDFVFNRTHWDLVICDECQHAPADTFRDVVERLRACSKRILGFTGTLCRSQLGAHVEEHVRRGTLSYQQATELSFSFLGPVLFRRSCADLEATGDIAKLNLRRIATPPISNQAFFCRAHALTEGVTRLYLAAMHPAKLEVLWRILHLHHGRGDHGMVFVDHLLHASILKDMLGTRWAVLAGADMNDMARSTSATSNRELVKRFNAGELDGIIVSPVGESSLDACSNLFRFIVVFDAHGGAATASQRLGRGARTARVPREEGEDDASLIARQRAVQKVAFYYELVTPLTEEVVAADKRREQFEAEGYEIPEMRFDDFMQGTAAVAQQGRAFPYASEDDQLRLLHRVLTHQERQAAETAGRAAARTVREGHREKVNVAKQRATQCPSPIFRERYSKQAKQLQKASANVQLVANEERNRAILAHEAPAEARKIFDQLGVAPERLAALGLVY